MSIAMNISEYTSDEFACPITIADRMKLAESRVDVLVNAGRPIVARLDGRAFHSFTKGCEYPHDARLSTCMIHTAARLVSEFQADVGYTQSDEISLIFLPKKGKDFIFNGRVQKLVSAMASKCAIYFNQILAEEIPELLRKEPTLDARVFNLEDINEVMDYLTWRVRDAVKNSIGMLSTCHFGTETLIGLTTDERLYLLDEIGVTWENEPDHFRLGTFLKKRKEMVELSIDEIEKLPEHHIARRTGQTTVSRSYVTVLPVTDIRENRRVQLHEVFPEMFETEQFQSAA